jgi:hypothetical protein
LLSHPRLHCCQGRSQTTEPLMSVLLSTDVRSSNLQCQTVTNIDFIGIHRCQMTTIKGLGSATDCCGSAPGAFPVETPFFLTEHHHYPRPRHPFLLSLTPACSHKGTSRFVSFSWLFLMYLNLCRLVQFICIFPVQCLIRWIKLGCMASYLPQFTWMVSKNL